jgi:cytochrome P450
VHVANIDEVSDLEACKLLAANAQNLNLVISETLRHTHSACIRIDKTTRKKLELSKIENPSGIASQVSITKS